MLPILDQLFLFHKLLPVCTLQWVEIVFEVHSEKIKFQNQIHINYLTERNISWRCEIRIFLEEFKTPKLTDLQFFVKMSRFFQ